MQSTNVLLSKPEITLIDISMESVELFFSKKSKNNPSSPLRACFTQKMYGRMRYAWWWVDDDDSSGKTNLFNLRLWKNHTRKNWRKSFKITYKSFELRRIIITETKYSFILYSEFKVKTENQR